MKNYRREAYFFKFSTQINQPDAMVLFKTNSVLLFFTFSIKTLL
jgi:hypothetical protein